MIVSLSLCFLFEALDSFSCNFNYVSLKGVLSVHGIIWCPLFSFFFWLSYTCLKNK